MDIQEYFKENKKLIYVMGALYIIIMAFVIYYIWKPKDTSNPIIHYTEIIESDMQNKVMQQYMENIAFNFVLEEEESIKEMFDQSYLKYTGLTEDELIQELRSEGFFSIDTQITSVKQYILGDIYIYRGMLVNGTRTRNVNVIEEYPNEYKITFDNFYKYSDENKSIEEEKIKFEISQSINEITSIKYRVKITNLENEYAIFKLNDIKNIVIGLEDGSEFASINPIKGMENKTTFSKGSSISLNLSFNVPLQSQEKIKYLKFKGVQVDGMEDDIIVNI